MANLDPFTAQIVAYVRKMPDEVLLELVRAQLGSDGSVQLPSGGGARTQRASQSSPQSASSPRTSTKRTANKSTATKNRAASKPKRKGRTQRASAEQREQLLDTVEKLVKKSRGVSSSEIAKKAGVTQTRVTAALRDLKGNKRIYQGGERRFARYAGDQKTAKAASERARKNAGGPKR